LKESNSRAWFERDSKPKEDEDEDDDDEDDDTIAPLQQKALLATRALLKAKLLRYRGCRVCSLTA